MPERKEKNYWPVMIIGFIFIGIALGYWTVKSASMMPVQKSNDYMLSSHQTDATINEIQQKQHAFNEAYMIKLVGKERKVFNTNIHSKVPPKPAVILQKDANSFTFEIRRKDGRLVEDANVSFLLTRPHTTQDDIKVAQVPFDNGTYVIKDINVTKPGRYELMLKVEIDNDHIGHYKEPAYLEPSKEQ